MKPLAIAFALVAAFCVAGCGSSKVSGSASAQGKPDPAVCTGNYSSDYKRKHGCDDYVAPPPPPEQRCINLWKSGLNTGRSEAISLASVGRVYASVGFAADYPDECLVTLASPVISGMQFVETNNGYAPTASIDPGDLPSGVTWNAVPDSEGNLRLTDGG